MIKLTINNRVYEGVDEIIKALVSSEGEFLVEGDPKNLERIWEDVLWRAKKESFIFSYVHSINTIKGFVKRPSVVPRNSKERRTPSRHFRRRRASRTSKPSSRGRSRGKK